MANTIYVSSEQIEEDDQGACDMGKTEDQILQLLSSSGPLTLSEIAEKLDKKPKVVFRSLRKLFNNGMIDSDPRTRRYMIAEEKL